MKDLIVLEIDTNNNMNEKNKQLITYDRIVDAMIKGHKLRYLYPETNICCKIDQKIMGDDGDIEKILLMMYDHVIKKTKSLEKISHGYGDIKNINMNSIEMNHEFDTDYEYWKMKKFIGPLMEKHFMFKERDVEIFQKIQKGGFNFYKKKIKYEKKEDNPDLDIVCKLYKVNPKQIKNYQLKYYHTMTNSLYKPNNLYTMFDGINEFDYLEPLVRLMQCHQENSYYHKLYERNRRILENFENKNFRLNILDNISVIDRDTIILQYIKCRPNTFILTLWKPAIPSLNKFVELLEEHGIVYYIKTEQFNMNGLRNLMYWFYDDITRTASLELVEKKIKYIDSTETNNPCCFIVFDNINKKPLSGQGAKFKRELRDKLMDMTGLDKNKYRGNDLMHVNDYWHQTVEYSQLIFNNNSIKILNQQDCRNYTHDSMRVTNLKMQTLRHILYSDMSLLEMDRLLIMGGSIFYALGIRASNDIDALIIEAKSSCSPNLIDYVEKFFMNKESKFYFLDAGIEGSNSWDPSWTEKDNKIIKFLGIEKLQDRVLDPENFFYHQGIKLVTLDYEMAKKLLRNRTEDHVDFLMLNLLYPSIIRKYVRLVNKYANESVIDNTQSETMTSSIKSNTETDTEDPMEENTDNEFFIVSEKYSKIKGKYDDKYPDIKQKVLYRRYSKEQIDQVKHLRVFKDFFGILEN